MHLSTANQSFMPMGARVSVDKLPAHWLMAQLGKRVLRPGGIELTHRLLERLAVGPDDDVVELAPGLGATARALLERRPASYVGVERDAAAAAFTEKRLAGTSARVVRSDAIHVPLESGSASVVLGEAMLSMQPTDRKRAIVAEVARLLRTGGRYAIHELAVTPDSIDRAKLDEIARDLSRTIHVGVRIGTVDEWRSLLEEAGLTVEVIQLVPMRLLELDRLIGDEGVGGTARFVFNMLRTPGATRRLLAVRRSFRKHAAHLWAVAMIARRD